MSFGIITKNRKRGSITKENKTEWRNERRVKMLSRMGYSVGNIQAMTHAKQGGISSHHVEKILKHKVNEKEMHFDRPNL